MRPHHHIITITKHFVCRQIRCSRVVRPHEEAVRPHGSPWANFRFNQSMVVRPHTFCQSATNASAPQRRAPARLSVRTHDCFERILCFFSHSSMRPHILMCALAYPLMCARTNNRVPARFSRRPLF